MSSKQIDKIAKNLLENKTCSNCWLKIYLPRGKCIIPVANMNQEGIDYRTRAKENTCKDWTNKWIETNLINSLK